MWAVESAAFRSRTAIAFRGVHLRRESRVGVALIGLA